MSADIIVEFLETITAGQNLTAGPATQIPNSTLMGLLRDKKRMDWLERLKALERSTPPGEFQIFNAPGTFSREELDAMIDSNPNI